MFNKSKYKYRTPESWAKDLSIVGLEIIKNPWNNYQWKNVEITRGQFLEQIINYGKVKFSLGRGV